MRYTFYCCMLADLLDLLKAKQNKVLATDWQVRTYEVEKQGNQVIRLLSQTGFHNVLMFRFTYNPRFNVVLKCRIII